MCGRNFVQFSRLEMDGSDPSEDVVLVMVENFLRRIQVYHVSLE